MAAVYAIVVTYNRREHLRGCLGALRAQSQRADHILVVDNASTDGTAAMVEQEYGDVELLSLPRNEGGAGGFHEGMKHAYERGAQWMWLMDDDTYPTADALAELLGAAGRLQPRPMLLASYVTWRDGSLHPMNFPTLERRRMELVVGGAEHGILPVRSATFVSLLVHREAVRRHGLPLKHFFLWSDDIEYTSRVVLAGGGAYFVPRSVALHDTAAPEDFRSAHPSRFYYHVRNTLLTARGPGRPSRDRLLRLWILFSTCAAYLLKRRSAQSASAIARGLRDGLRDAPHPKQP